MLGKDKSWKIGLGEFPEQNLGKSQGRSPKRDKKDKKADKKGRTSPDRETRMKPPRLKHPRLAALETPSVQPPEALYD